MQRIAERAAAARPSTAVRITDDPYQPHVAFAGPSWRAGDPTTGDSSVVLALRSEVDRSTGATRHQLDVVVFYRGEWRAYDRANTRAAEPAPFVEIDRAVDDCSGGSPCRLRETFGLRITDAELQRAAAGDGLAYKSYARSGHAVELLVSADVARRQLTAIETWRAKAGKSTPNP